MGGSLSHVPPSVQVSNLRPLILYPLSHSNSTLVPWSSGEVPYDLSPVKCKNIDPCLGAVSFLHPLDCPERRMVNQWLARGHESSRREKPTLTTRCFVTPSAIWQANPSVVSLQRVSFPAVVRYFIPVQVRTGTDSSIGKIIRRTARDSWKKS